MKQTKLLLLLLGFFLFLGIQQNVWSQGVTTSAIEGMVMTVGNEPLSDANIVAVHVPSGTRYGTTTRSDGRFNLPNLRTGGPYSVRVTYVGFQADEITDLRLTLGETRSLLFIMVEEGRVLEEVIVRGVMDPVMNADRTGASTNVSSENISQMPTISRTIEDFTRLSPLSNGSSFAGRDNRFNNYTVDGNIYNNNFGLGSGQFAASNPISMDAIEEIQINIAPFDVRQGGFTGANVNAITRSGTNEFRGSIYSYFRNEYMIGRKIGDDSFSVDEALTSINGVSVGGPIIRDRLFFFVSVEQEESSVPGDSRLAARPGLSGPNVTRVPADQMDFVREQMRNVYGYETGAYENYPFANEALRLNFRLDFNINPKHRASLRYNRYSAFRDININGNSVRNVTRYGNTNRFGLEALTFRNANYSVDNNVNSFVAELNSIFGTNFANNLNVGFTFVEDPKRSVPNGQTFPFVEVLEWEGGAKPGDVDGDGNPLPLGTPQYYFALGNELFTVGNLLQNDIFNITNNFSMFMGRHTFTVGLNLEYMTFNNAFNPNAHTFYRFNSYQNFVDVVINRVPGATPDGFATSYSYEGPGDLPLDQTAFGQFGIYFQDKIEVSRDLVFTAGLRIDFPFFPVDLPNNPRLDEIFQDPAQAFIDPSDPDNRIVPDVSTLPGVKPLLSPRLSFNYDVFGDNSLRLRGGSGFFSGRIPFVWVSNQVSANGVTRGFMGWDRWQLREDEDGNEYWQENTWGTGGRPQWQGFADDPSVYKPSGDQLQAQVSRDINITDPNFRFPQVWRTNIAADYRLPLDIIGTLEGIYSKDFNSPLAQNINLAAPAGTFSGVDQRPYFTSYAENGNFNEVMMLTNTNQGYYWSVTAQLQKDFMTGVFGSLAYTRGVSRDYGLIGGSQAASLWPNVVAEDRNNPEMGYSRFDQPNRIVSFFTFDTRALSSRNTSSFSIYYTGGEGGRYSYVYAGNFGDRASRLMYIPRDASEINLIPVTVGGQEISPADQWNILNRFIDQDDYLSANRGNVAERNGALLPWVNRFDFRFAQDINLTNLPDRHKLQITFDILNVGNLLNSEWGVANTVWQSAPLTYRGRNADTNQPNYSINVPSGLNSLPGTGPELDQAFRENSYRRLVNINQTWRLQVGIRYLL